MKRKILFALVCGAFACTIMCESQCTKNRMPKATEIEGKWLLGINTTEYVGADTLTFRNDGLFIDTKSVRYSGSDSGFDFSVHMSTYMEGEWNLKNDTLHIAYGIEKPEIKFDKKLSK